MKKQRGSLQCALDTSSNSPLGMGSEFRKIPTIKVIFMHHPIWPQIKRILVDGLHWPLEEVNKNLRIADVNEAIKFGNREGATNNPVPLRELIENNVRYGYCIPPPPAKSKAHPQPALCPNEHPTSKHNRQDKKTINKERLTQSYKWGRSGTLVNSRTIKELLMPCIYSTCLKWLINWTITARRKYPNRRIMASKINFKSAFHWCNLSAATAIQCCTQHPTKELILLYLRLTFGGSPCPNK
jgi:hypothetical protein